jgi:hypothetical protein
LISKITRTRIKGKGAPQATGKPNEAHIFNHNMPTPSEDSSEGASDDNEDDGGHEDGSSCVSDNTRLISNMSSHVVPGQISNMNISNMSSLVVPGQISNMNSHAVPAHFKDEVFDEKLNAMFSESLSPNQNSGYASIEKMSLEPLPVDSAGILDEPGNRNNSELAEFGQLLGRL